MATNYSPNIVTNGLVLSLDVGDKNSYIGSGTTWSDLSPNGNDGTLTAAAVATDVPGSMDFNGSSEYVTVANSTSLRISNPGSATIGVWILIDDASDVNGIIGPWSSTGNAGWGITGGYPSSAVSMIVDDGEDGSAHWVGQNTPKVTLSADGKFHYVVVTVIRNGNGSDATLSHYLDGIFYNSITFSDENGAAAWGAAGQDFLIGKLGDNYLDGKVSTAHMYNRILSLKEISQNFNAQRSRFGV